MERTVGRKRIAESRCRDRRHLHETRTDGKYSRRRRCLQRLHVSLRRAARNRLGENHRRRRVTDNRHCGFAHKEKTEMAAHCPALAQCRRARLLVRAIPVALAA